MQYTIISDTHLSAYIFDSAQFEALVDVISKSDRVILNGDFFDAYLSTFDAFYNSKWNKLFPLLKKKKAIYVYGNHDRPEYLDERVSEFTTEQTYRKELSSNDQTIVVQHGQSFAPDFDGRFPTLSYYLAWFYPRYFYHEQNETWLNKLVLRHYVRNKNIMIHKELKRSIEFYKKNNAHCRNHWFVCGHSHITEMDTKLRFANSGLFRNGFAQYAQIDDSGKIRLVVDSYSQEKKEFHEELAKSQTPSRKT